MNKWFLIIWIVPLLWSCSDENRVVDISKVPKATAHFSLSVADMKLSNGSASTRNVATRSTDPTSVNDSTVHDLWILQFSNGTLASKAYIGTVNLVTIDVQLAQVTGNIYFVANVGSSAFSSYTVGTTTESVFQSAGQPVSTESAVLEKIGSTNYVPMEGSLTNVTVPATGYMPTSTVALNAMVVRIDLNDTISVANFSVRTIRVCNVPNTMAYCPPASAATVFPASPSMMTTNAYEMDVTGVASPHHYTFYIPENQRGVGTNTSTDPTLKSGITNATYIELVGYTTGSNAGKETRYRLYPGANNYNDYNISRNTHYVVNATIKGRAVSDTRVISPSRANCYIVAPGHSVYIPLARANDSNDSNLGTQIANLAASGYTFGVLWQDMSSSTSNVVCSQSDIDRSCGVFKVTAAAGYTGNAVVYVKDSSGNILWSWHIWVTNYDPETSNTTIGSYTFMNMNLGTTSLVPSEGYKGLFYQWGRKDPFPQGSAQYSNTKENVYDGNGNLIASFPQSVVTTAPATNNLAASVRNPFIFYCVGGGAEGDWYSSTPNDNLWGDTKTVYDPCPTGWKVMPFAACTTAPYSFYNVSNYQDNCQTLYGCPLWAAYYGMYEYTGNYDSSEWYTLYWSSTLYDHLDGHDLYINSGGVNTTDYTGRSYACCIRCVKE